MLKCILARNVDFFGAQRVTQMKNLDAPFCINCADAELGQFPWQLSLQTSSHFCGASLLSDTAFATAAHCRKSSYYAIAGTIDNQDGQKIEANVFIGHPYYTIYCNGPKIERKKCSDIGHCRRLGENSPQKITTCAVSFWSEITKDCTCPFGKSNSEV